MSDKPSTLEREELIFYLKYATQIKLQRLQDILDAVVLAAEQVQDKRIELLEDGPETNTSNLIVDLFICFILESSLAGQLVRLATKAVLSSFLRSRMLTELIIPGQAKRNSIAGLIKLNKNVSPSTKSNLKEFRELINEEKLAIGEMSEYLKYRQYCKKLMNGDFNTENTVAAGKAANMLRTELRDKEYFGGINLSEATNSPGVSLLKSVQGYVSGFREAINNDTFALEFVLRFEDLTCEEYQIYKDVIMYDFNKLSLQSYDSEAVIEKFMYQFEALIWAKLCKFDVSQVKPNYKSYLELNGNKLAGKRLMYYLKRRFENFIYEQAKNDKNLMNKIDSEYEKYENNLKENSRDRSNRKYLALVKYFILLDNFSVPNLDINDAIGVSQPAYPKD